MIFATPAPRLILFDCDSTLRAIEGVDELARGRGPAVLAACEALTNDAMEGRLRVEEVFARRLELVAPAAADAGAVARRYVEMIEPTAEATLAELRRRGWTTMILSGGFRPMIVPLAERLGIGRIEAVELWFDAATGAYADFDRDYPTTRSGGKPEVVARLRAEFSPSSIVMVGDGVSDLETRPVVDRFIGFGRYVVRPKVKAGAEFFVHALDDVLALLP